MTLINWKSYREKRSSRENDNCYFFEEILEHTSFQSKMDVVTVAASEKYSWPGRVAQFVRA